MLSRLFPVGLLLLCFTVGDGGRLSVSGSHFVKDGQRVFLSGTNLAWVHYGSDFGNHHYTGVRGQMEHFLAQIQAAGGNSIRIWLHIEGDTTPHFTSDGHVDKPDAGGTLISDLHSFLQAAQRHNVLVFITLWNGAKNQSPHYRLNGLIVDTNKLQSYIDHALVPMVNALKGEPALGGWDIMNEPEGELRPGVQSNNPCQDTSHLAGSGAGWEGHLYTAQQLQRFINWQAHAIRIHDPGAMVTVGTWNPKSNTDRFGFKNLYKDSCLVEAGGRNKGTLTFYQVHTYASNGQWDGYSPFQKHYNDYGLDKPLVIGEYRESDAAGERITDLYNHAYYYGYSGGWGWQAVDGNAWGSIQTGMAWLKGRNDQAKGGQVNFNV
ncbi:mannan endo-1,4-beta-mannosidase-like [Mya arenaria]|uniref:mannan endo-1,4-beta-mannosidase-like n=1 Tax=Mya arenaria TaxID=6604 RepID=UPI0022E27162|nr:mannan endo-1,4-beta-mannosidase-like [Mya arenaria]